MAVNIHNKPTPTFTSTGTDGRANELINTFELTTINGITARKAA